METLEKERRELAKRIRRMEVSVFLKEIGNPLPPFVVPFERQELDRLQGLLGQLDSQLLEREAVTWGIDIPDSSNKPDWYTAKTKNPYPDDLPGEMVMLVNDWLNEKGRTIVTKQIRDARFEYWRGWAQILIPILSLIVAILALLKK